MKRWIVIIIITIFAAACSNQDLLDEEKNNILINVVNETDINIYALELDWAQNGIIKGTQGAMYADGSQLKRGESLTFELLETEVNTEEAVELLVTLLGKQQQQLGSTSPCILKMETNKTYNFELIEDGEISLKEIK